MNHRRKLGIKRRIEAEGYKALKGAALIAYAKERGIHASKNWRDSTIIAKIEEL